RRRSRRADERRTWRCCEADDRRRPGDGWSARSTLRGSLRTASGAARRRCGYSPPKYDGIGKSRIVRSPGGEARTFGIELTTIDAVATSPWTPPAIFIESRGDPSTVTESYDSGAPRYASMRSE